MNNLMVRILIAFLMLPVAVAQAETEKLLRISEEDISAAIQQEISDRGMTDGGTVELEFFGGQTDFRIEGASEAKILVNNLKLDENLGRFNCEVEIFADREPYKVSALQGKFFPLVEVWVPAQNIAKGELLTDTMLQNKIIRQSKLKPFMVSEKDKLVGLEAKKPLKEGKIINEKDVGAKILVKRDDIVVAVYRTPQMQITAKVIVQQDGAFGDRIEVQNIKTRKILVGIVQDASTVVIEQ